MSIESYITCLTDCTLRYVEALAMIGLITEAYTTDCDRPRFKKITARLYNGREVTTMCYFDEEVNHSLRIINVYINLAKKNNAIGKLQVVESKGEE